MKKHIFILTVCAVAVVFSALNSSGADWATSAGSCYAKGDKILDVGIPFPAFQMGVHAAFDYGFHDAISGGGGVGFIYYYPYLGDLGGATYFTFLVRAAFHPFNLTVLRDKIKVRDKLDTYVGLTVYASPSLNGYALEVWPREYIGARWHFSKKVSAFLEDCGGFGYLDGGISFNL